MTGWLWAIFTVTAALGQTFRNAMQKELTTTLGMVGATHVRFLYGLPFAALFLVGILLFTGQSLPPLNATMMTWVVVGALSQIAGTALLIAAMQQRSFVVTTALSKTEPVQVAIFGLVFLGDHISVGLAVAIVVATVGVVAMSWPKQSAADALSVNGALLGIASGALMGLAAVGYRGGVINTGSDNFVVAASMTLVVGLTFQVLLMTGYLLVRDCKTLVALFRAWRPSMTAGFMGAFASQMWCLAFALESAAKIRTLALVEILFAQILSRRAFQQGLASREAIGIGLIIVGVILLLNT